MIQLSETHLATIRQHGAETFPNECVGVLLGDVLKAEKQDASVSSVLKTLDLVKVVQEVRPLPNTFEPSAEFELSVLPEGEGTAEHEVATVGQERRYLLSPDTMFALMREERRTGRKVLGFYHSHPNHPAIPSVYDREWASPWYTYIIVSVLNGVPDALTAWQLTDDRSQFEPEEIES